MSGAMAQIWGMINGMQIYSNLPMFQVLFPKYSLAAMNEILDIAEFEVIPVGDLLWVVLDEPEKDYDPEVDVTLFENYDIESYYMVTNMGSIFVIFVMTITIPLLLIFLLKPCRNTSTYLNKKHNNLSRQIQGNLFIRYIIEACLDIAISCGL